MLRLLWSIALAGIVGGALAALIQGLGMVSLSGFVAYPVAAVMGIVIGLVAGKPIWAEGARIEALLKSIFGAILATGLMFALRTWVDFDVSSLGFSETNFGLLPATAFPSIALILSLLFEVDNMFGKGEENKDKKRIATSSATNQRIETADQVEQEEASTQANGARRKR